jgi:hypothetical protein
MAYRSTDVMKIKVQDHIRRVRYFGKVAQKLGYFTNDELFNNTINSHDADKLFPANLVKQSKRLYPAYVKKNTLCKKDDNEVNDVINKHIHSNAHHPEYWSKSKVNFLTNGVDATRMPNLYLTELCCDWMSVNEELGTGSLDWYNKVVDTRFIFSTAQKEYIKDCLLNLSLYSLDIMKRKYDLNTGVVYSNPCLNSILKFNAIYRDKQIITSLNDCVTVYLNHVPLLRFTIRKDSLLDADGHNEILFSSTCGKEELKRMIVNKLSAC